MTGRRIIEPYESPPDTVPDPVFHKSRDGVNACGRAGGYAMADWKDVTCEGCLMLPVPAQRRIT